MPELMNEIKDKKLREMLDESGLADITVFRKGNHVIVKKGDEFVAACKAAYRDISRERWIETIRHWLDTDERFCKKEPLTDEQMAVDMEDKFAWVLVNREGSHLLQYGYPTYEDEARRLLARAREKHPDAGIHLERVNK